MRFVKIIIGAIVTIIVSNYLDISFIKDNHFNLITINSVFIGFLFTSFTILLGFLDKNIIKYFNDAGVLKEVYKSIELGISSSIISIIFSIINLLIDNKIIVFKILISILHSLELYFLLLTIIYLIVTLRNTKILVDSIKSSIKQEKNTSEVDERIDNLIK